MSSFRSLVACTLLTTAEPSNDCALQGVAVIDGGSVLLTDRPFRGIHH